jgi:integrase
MVKEWIDLHFPSIRKKGRSSNYKRNWMRAIARMCNWAVEEEIIVGSPLATLKKPAQKPRDAIITQEQWSRFVAVNEKRGEKGAALLEICMILRLTGCRPQEARRIEAKHIDHEARCIEFEREITKGETEERTVERRIVPLTDQAYAMCQRLSEKHPSGPIFRSPDGQPWTNAKLKDHFARLTKRIKRKRHGKVYVTEPPLNFAMTPYTIRHTWATDALTRQVDVITVSKLMGHKDLKQLSETYAKVERKSQHMRAMLHAAVGETPAGPTKIA